MKKMMLLAVAALFGAGIVCAALTADDLTPKAIRTAVAALPTNQRTDYARQMIEAVAATPQDETAKTQALTSTARALIAGARTGGAISIIAEVYNTVPVTNLQGVSDLLASNNFGQKLNGMTDAQYDGFAARLIGSASKYIIASGTDSPTLRISILVAAFTKGSEDPERTRELLIAALPTSMQAAAATYIAASEQNNNDVIAAAAGVDAVEPTPADPDAASVVQPTTTDTAATATDAEAAADATSTNATADATATADAAGATTADASDTDAATAEATDASDATATAGAVAAVAGATAGADASDATIVVSEEDEKAAPEARFDYLQADAAEATDTATTSDTVEVVDADPVAEAESTAKVPLIARLSGDIQGATIDAMNMAMYDWDSIDPEERIDNPTVASLPGLGSVNAVPGAADITAPETLPEWRAEDFDVEEVAPPSPVYPNQRIGGTL